MLRPVPNDGSLPSRPLIYPPTPVVAPAPAQRDLVGEPPPINYLCALRRFIPPTALDPLSWGPPHPRGLAVLLLISRPSSRAGWQGPSIGGQARAACLTCAKRSLPNYIPPTRCGPSPPTSHLPGAVPPHPHPTYPVRSLPTHIPPTRCGHLSPTQSLTTSHLPGAKSPITSHLPGTCHLPGAITSHALQQQPSPSST